MNDALRKKLTEQQDRVKELAEWRLIAIDNDARKAHEERDAIRLKMLKMYALGVKDMKVSIISAIEAEKQKKGRTEK